MLNVYQLRNTGICSRFPIFVIHMLKIDRIPVGQTLVIRQPMVACILMGIIFKDCEKKFASNLTPILNQVN